MPKYRFLSALLALASCDHVTTGTLCNESTDEIQIVVSPFNNKPGSPLINNQLQLTQWDSVNATGYFTLEKQKCTLVARGSNNFTPDDISFDHIEIRTPTDTLSYESKTAIHEQFRETSKHSYTWIID